MCMQVGNIAGDRLSGWSCEFEDGHGKTSISANERRSFTIWKEGMSLFRRTAEA